MQVSTPAVALKGERKEPEEVVDVEVLRVDLVVVVELGVLKTKMNVGWKVEDVIQVLVPALTPISNVGSKTVEIWEDNVKRTGLPAMTVKMKMLL